jgi:hypothetical protein
MPASIEFHSVTPRPVDDHTRLHLIRKELEAMSIRQERLHMMDSDPYFADCIDEVVERIKEYEDYDPTPDYAGEPPITMAEMHAGAWREHQLFHS